MVSRRVEEACSLAGEAAQKYMKSIVMEDSRALEEQKSTEEQHSCRRVRQFEEQLCDGKQHGGGRVARHWKNSTV